MKGFNILLVFLLGLLSCQSQEQNKIVSSTVQDSGMFYGEEFKLNTVEQESEIWKKYATMAIQDSVKMQFKTIVKEVCKVKGCWMVVELPQGEQAMVRFKDYAFFMPSDIPGKEVILNGLAFVEEMTVNDQRHYAKDANKSDEDIAKITTPKRTFSFEASGVLVPN
ncbi:DUF4920 domain-containing protein [Maribacter hydrothermalis]|uniref:DUF4920 domain-containing protein n=1 Tax=Maribacter hydrothermalis TaxID=1836467 RepID=A0A1B7Z1J2_9FLAO|nr:DUF4920 domain-containing protein [Maribacter hydrothermalis]APQ18207.1 DUF4920 domain-containing protein [Maribacter hydrothermalis]OBR36554.1 DUF4920 domain-containing protein [Maribacter hydrothermalis]